MSISHISPQSAWQRLVDGNARLVAGVPQYPHQDVPRREQLRQGQHPIAAVVGCSDSRVPVELVFDQGFGDVFVIRTAGQTIDDAVLGSIEYAVCGLGVSVLVVLGHQACGAVQATRDALASGQMPEGFQQVLVEKVGVNVAAAGADADAGTCERTHIRKTLERVVELSPALRQAVETGEVGAVAARYLLDSGAVETLETRGL